MTKEIKDVHSIVQDIIDAIDNDPNDSIQYDKPSMGFMGRSGHADFRILYQGVWIDVECKADMWLDYPHKLSTAKNRLPTLPQLEQLERTEKAGGLALVVDIHTARKLYDLLYQMKFYANNNAVLPDAASVQHLCSAMHWRQFSREIKDIKL